MSKKYKELPAFETNEFKVGDNARVYTGCEEPHFEELVVNIEGDYLYLKNMKAHFKQCRKMEEIKPREFTLIRWAGSSCFDVAKDGYKPAGPAVIAEIIKVREVLDETEGDK